MSEDFLITIAKNDDFVITKEMVNFNYNTECRIEYLVKKIFKDIDGKEALRPVKIENLSTLDTFKLIQFLIGELDKKRC